MRAKLSPKNIKVRPVQRKMSNSSNRKNPKLLKQRRYAPPSPLGRRGSLSRPASVRLKAASLPSRQLRVVNICGDAVLL